MKLKTLISAITLTFVLLATNLKAQLKIGYKSRELEAPIITLLELKVDPAATYGKGFTYPNVTQTQRDRMRDINGGTIPNGMSVFNSSENALQVYSADPGINDWLSFSPLKSEILKITQLGLNPIVVDTKDTYTFNSNRNLTPDGKVYIVYNHIALKKGVDFTVNTTTKQITFKTLIPENFDGFTQFEVEFNL